MTLPNKKVIIVGISGATCSGKTTIAKELNKILENSQIFCQDNYFFPVDDPRHVFIPELNHINWDIVGALDMEKMTEEVRQHATEQSRTIPVVVNGQNGKQKNTISQINESGLHVIIVEGFCIFNYQPLADLCNLKYYFTLSYEECFRRRQRRVYEPPDVPGYFEKCVWPEHLKQLDDVRKNVENLVFFDENTTNELEKVLQDIVNALR